MKKTLYEIFDEATPKELEQLSENLKASITMDNEMLTLVKNKVYAKTKLAESRKGRIITMKKEIKFSRLHRSILAGAACLAMVLLCNLENFISFFIVMILPFLLSASLVLA